ncbi:hypothetical protein CHY_1936 [Carboxydothermus hydrogenoformans Z-2901]|uniref:Uncharacterized protein n=1 Tax=Carboxydothermus hydrogenoformans (strain ATCC BAA-161 / DSM 6008 / Z-2901) TaxID=246194 RepID=Q3AAS9_CARHZ|nr:hypothetical protein CHY_1936 [Carboxydothermus hydrogenoformans Z-2901]
MVFAFFLKNPAGIFTLSSGNLTKAIKKSFKEGYRERSYYCLF